MSEIVVSLLLLAGLLSAVPAAYAQQVEGRRIIAFHHPQGEKLKLHDIHRLAEMPLNWLGYVLDYRELSDGLPEDAITDPDVVGVITWFKQAGMDGPEDYIDWAGRMADAGKKFIIFGDFGFVAGHDGDPPVDITKINELLEKLGFRALGGWSDITFDSEITYRDPEFYDFERRMAGRLPPYELLEPATDATRAVLKVRNRASGEESAPFMISPNAVYVATNWASYKDPVFFRTQWYVNPFRLFETLLGDETRPVPDITTLSGRRTYFSHIDGDGWRNVSLVKPYKKDQIYSAQVVLEEAIRPYPDMPVSVGPIAADLDPAWSGDAESQQIARDLFLLPQVEMAHHTYSHPFEWAFFEEYTQEKEAPFVPLYDNPSAEAWGVDAVRGRVKQEVSLKDAYDQPRGFGTFPFVLEREFGEAAAYVNRFAPPGKKVELVLWSGDTSPTERMIRASRDAGLLNVNGGDSRFDPEFPSVTYVPAVGFAAGKEQQIYAANSNENTYTDLWSGRYFGYRDLVHTLRNTELPRRLKPINIYYHMYSGERTNALNGLIANLDFARSQKIMPITTSHFARIGEGFYTTRFSRLGPRSWEILDRGWLQTIRFDKADQLSVDMVGSKGVLGQNRHQGSLYVALDETVGRPVVTLTDRNKSVVTPHLIEARWHVWDLVTEKQKLSFSARGFGDGEMVWAGLTPGVWRAEVSGPEGQAVSFDAETDAEGRLSITLAVDAIAPVRVTLRQQSGG